MSYKKIFSIALLMSLFAAPACQAVEIDDVDLSVIGDIIRHVTNKASGDLTFDKESLLLVKEQGGALDICVYRFKTDGSSSVAVEKQSDKAPGLVSIGNRNFQPGLPIAALPFDLSEKDSTEMKALVTLPYASSNGQKTGRYLSITQHQDANKNVSLTADDSSGQSLVECLNLSTMPLEVKNGITVSSSDIALSAVLVRDGAAATVYFVTLDVTPDKAAVRAISNKDGGLLSMSVTINEDVLPTMADVAKTPYFPVSMAVGDFDNDGYKNEIALAWSDIDHVNLEVLQLSFDGIQFSVGLMYSSTVYNYTYDNIRLGRDIGKNLDGVTSVYSTSVVAGDFDGDGRDEFAVVFRDNAPGDSKIYYNEYNEYFGDGISFPIIFDGLTGKIHVVTHQWAGDEGKFLTSEKIKNYDSFTVDRTFPVYNIPLAVKAVAADVNGDGRDDIVTMIIRFDFYLLPNYDYKEEKNTTCFDTFSLSGYVDWDVGASEGSFGKLIFHAETDDPDARGIGGGWNDDPFPGYPIVGYNPDPLTKHNPTFLRDPIRTTLTEGSTYYPYMEHEFDIAAGEFTGRIGEVITVDDLVIKRPDGYEDVWVFDSDIGGLNWNKLKSAVSLVYNLDDRDDWYWDKWGARMWGKTKQIASFPRDYAVGLVPGNYLSEGVKLGDPIKITDTTDLDYIAILQMVPYHVDNVTTDSHGKLIILDKPINFTLVKDTAVTYGKNSGSTDTSQVSYNMTTSTETIFAIDNPILSKTSKTFQGIRGISSALFGDTNSKTAKGIEEAGKIWDKLKDTVEETTSTANKNETNYTLSMTVKADRLDTLFMDTSTRYLWRYPVLTHPVPDWLIGQLKDTTISSDKAQLKDQQTYVTFAMSDPDMPTVAFGTHDSHYQPYHEIGNLFSYPSDIKGIDGYSESTYIKNTNSTRSKAQTDGTYAWEGPETTWSLTFVNKTMSQEETKKVNKTGAITNFLSAFDSLFKTDLADIPQNSDSAFTKNVTDGELLTVKIPTSQSDAGFSVNFAPYLDTAGTTTAAFAVTSIGSGSLWAPYSKGPDPSLLLPEKFSYNSNRSGGKLDNNSASFGPTYDDPTAMKMRGLRFYLADYDDTPTDSPLVKGLTYKIKVPVYNASFVDAKDFKVHLSYTVSCDYNAERYQIGEYTFGENNPLYGWGNGNNRQFAEFLWSPDVNIQDGIYYLFADIDSEDKLTKEIHKNRRNASGDIVDVGGNNMGYVRVSLVSADATSIPKSYRAEVSAAGRVTTAGADSSSFPRVYGLKANGLDPDDFLRREVLGADGPVPVELYMDYDGDCVMHDAELMGYKLKPEAKGKTVGQLANGDIELYFLIDEFDLLPGAEHKTHFKMDPRYLEDGPECIRFAVKAAGTEYPLYDIENIASPSSGGGSGGGCSAGFGTLAAVAVLFGAVSIVRKRR